MMGGFKSGGKLDDLSLGKCRLGAGVGGNLPSIFLKDKQTRRALRR